MFYYGVVSRFKNLQTSVLGTNLIMEKAGRCQSTMALTSSIILPFQPQSRIALDPLLLNSLASYSFFWLCCMVVLLMVHFISSTQLPNAVGAAYSLKMDRKDACAVTYFGDGGTSEVSNKTWIFRT